MGTQEEAQQNHSEYYKASITETINQLETSQTGLTQTEAEKRLQKHGPNELIEEKKTTPLEIFLDQVKSILILILIVAALISGLILHEYTDMAVILIIVVLNSIIGFIQEYRAEQAVEALKQMVSPHSKVIREGNTKDIPAREIVPGDILLICEGDRIPADGRLIEAISLKIDESPLTGESMTATKKTETITEETPLAQRNNMIYMGTHASYGRGQAIITATGMNTEFGNIAQLIQSIEEEESPLKQKTEKLGKQLGIIALIGCIIVFTVDYLNGVTLVESFMTAVSLAISAIPEGLPTVLIITLSLGAQRMATSNAIIRRLNSVETLGTTTVICTDKTGTITKNEMTVRQINTNSHTVKVTGEGYTPTGKFINQNNEKIQPQETPELRLILKTGLLCNDSSIIDDPNIGQYLIGDPTEGAILVAAIKAGLIPKNVEDENKRIWEAPFDSIRKMMSTVNKSKTGYTVNSKGAPEVILEKCTQIHINGETHSLTEQKKDEIRKQVEEMAENALRVLAFANKPVPESDNYTQEEIESNLTYIGVMGMMDPPREEVRQAIELCKRSGIRPIMITGDHEATANAIAREVGIISDTENRAITGLELSKMTEEELQIQVNTINVYARASPEHKLRIAQALRAQGNIVAMTGDGVNDAAAIKAADIGIAMGIKGTDVTKEAADMVLTDDNFATIVKAVEQGRIIYDNIRKFMRFMISSNFDEMIIITLFILAGLPAPFLPIMILWLNLITDGGPAIALSMDKPTDDLMSKPPRDPRHGILHGMYLFIAAYVVMQSVTMAGTFIWKYVIQGASLEYSRTVTFMQVCMFELVVVWNCRSEQHSVFKTGLDNRFLLIATIIGGVLTASICYVPLLQSIFKTIPLQLQDWLWVLGTALAGLLVLPEIFFKQDKSP